MCSASFPLRFSSPTRTGLVCPIPEWNLVILRRHSSFASTLSNFLRHRCHHTSTTPVSMPPTYPETTIHPSQWAAPIRRAVLYCLISTCVLRTWGTLLLARFLLPVIFSISNYLCPDRLFWLGFLFSPLTWHQKLAHLTNVLFPSMGLMWFVNLGMLLQARFLFLRVILIRSWECLCIWMHDHSMMHFVNDTRSIRVLTLYRVAPIRRAEYFSSILLVHYRPRLTPFCTCALSATSQT